MSDTSRPRARDVAPVIILALLLMLPAWVASPLVRDSFWIDFVWADQFSAQLREGTLYPRWLAESHNGLGAPVFYFYPPLAFYLAAILSLMGLSTYWSVLAAFGVAMAGSGIAMLHWLKGWTSRPLAGALLYVAAPYHIVDFYARGALAEFCAYALLPLVAIGIRRAARSGRFAMLAISYAALIITHLPAALLTSLFFIAPYCLYLASKNRQALHPMLLGGLFGIGLASIYLLPMVALQPHVALETMVMRPDLQAPNWSLLTPWSWPAREGIILMAALAATVVFAAAILLIARRDVWLFAVCAYAVILLGLIPGLWSLPLLAKVQFPWRMLMLAEFALVTAFARAKVGPVTAALAIAPMLALSAMMIPTAPTAKPDAFDEYKAFHADVIEYLPKGAPFSDAGYSQWALDLARQHPRDARIGKDVIAADFYFPSWQVNCEGQTVATWPDPATKLLRWTGKNCATRIGWTAIEWWGALISALSVVLLFGVKRRRDTAPKRTGLRLPMQVDIASSHAPTALSQ
ncbi:MAG: hypothetical protein AABY88_02965 [Pseudomonadota bacterium]